MWCFAHEVISTKLGACPIKKWWRKIEKSFILIFDMCKKSYRKWTMWSRWTDVYSKKTIENRHLFWVFATPIHGVLLFAAPRRSLVRCLCPTLDNSLLIFIIFLLHQPLLFCVLEIWSLPSPINGTITIVIPRKIVAIASITELLTLDGYAVVLINVILLISCVNTSPYVHAAATCWWLAV